MIKKLTFIIVVIFTSVWLCVGCGLQPTAKKPAPIIIPGGTVAPALGIGFDATYDPTLDEVVPGYKIMTVAYTNNSMNIVQMNPSHDMWYVVDRRGKKIKAMTNLRNQDPDTWSKLPKRLKILIEYPLLIPIGSTQTIDLLFKNKINLGEFQSVVFRAANSNQEYRILPREQ